MAKRIALDRLRHMTKQRSIRRPLPPQDRLEDARSDAADEPAGGGDRGEP